MPASSAAKRVKNKRIARPFIIGSEAWPLTPALRTSNTPPDHTKGWRVYVRAPPGQPDISRWLKKVSFKIFHTYDTPTRVFEHPPFCVEETGWGGFQVDIRLYFAPEVAAKPEYRTHYLQLEAYGDDEQRAAQLAAGVVRSEFLEVVEFNEPPEALWESLTDPAQPKTIQVVSGAPGSGAAGKKGRGKTVAASAPAARMGAAGKGGKGAKGGIVDEGATVELPAQSGTGQPFSKEVEAGLLDVLARAERQVETLLGEEKVALEGKHKVLLELKSEET